MCLSTELFYRTYIFRFIRRIPMVQGSSKLEVCGMGPKLMQDTEQYILASIGTIEKVGGRTIKKSEAWKEKKGKDVQKKGKSRA